MSDILKENVNSPRAKHKRGVREKLMKLFRGYQETKNVVIKYPWRKGELLPCSHGIVKNPMCTVAPCPAIQPFPACIWLRYRGAPSYWTWVTSQYIWILASWLLGNKRTSSGVGLSPKVTAGVGITLTMEDAEHVLRNILCADLQPTDHAAAALA